MAVATILVVDDERNILTSVSRALGLEGYGVEVAGSAEVALDKLAKQTFDAILLDAPCSATKAAASASSTASGSSPPRRLPALS